MDNLTEDQQKAKLLAEAAGMVYVPVDAVEEDKGTDDKGADDKKTDDQDDSKGADDKGDQDGDAGKDTGKDGGAGDGASSDDDKGDSSGDQKKDTSNSPDQGDDKKVLLDSGKSDEGSDQQASFETSLAERSGGRFNSMADIDKALEDAPANAFANEQIAKLNDYVKGGGSLNDFVTTQTVDYSEMNPLELIQAHRKMRDKDLTAEEIRIEMEEDFGVAENASDREKTLAGIKLKRQGAEALKELQTHQQKWSTPLADKTADRAANLEKWENQLNVAVDAAESIDIALNQTDNFSFKLEDTAKAKIKSDYKEIDKFFGRYIDKDGKEDTARFVRDMAILENFEAIVRSAASGSKSQGKKDVVDGLKNPEFKGEGKKDGVSDKTLSIADQAAKAFFGG